MILSLSRHYIWRVFYLKIPKLYETDCTETNDFKLVINVLSKFHKASDNTLGMNIVKWDRNLLRVWLDKLR